VLGQIDDDVLEFQPFADRGGPDAPSCVRSRASSSATE
jgi:hypothetical protein